MKIGPNLHDEHLVYGHDTGYGVANIGVSTKHYPGKPTTNLTSSTLTNVFSNWGGLVGTSTTYTDGYLGGSGVHVVITTGGGVNWWSSPSLTGLSGNTQYTVSATIKSTGATPSANTFYIREYNSSDTQLKEQGYWSNSRMIDLGGGWYRAWGTVTTQSATVRILLHGYSYSSNTNIKIQDLQFEAGSVASPFAGYGGSRSNTGSLIDLTGETNIDVTSASWTTDDGQIDLDGTGDHFETSTNCGLTSDITIEAVFKEEGATSPHTTVLCTDTNYQRGVKLMSFCNTNRYGLWLGFGSSNHHAMVNETLNNDTVYHLVASWSQGTGQAKIYLNGVLKSTQSTGQTGQISLANGLIHTGIDYHGLGNSYGLNGQVYVGRIYNKVLTDAEVQHNYSVYKNRFNI